MNLKFCTRFSGFSVILKDNLYLSDLHIFFLKPGTVSHITLFVEIVQRTAIRNRSRILSQYLLYEVATEVDNI